MVKQTTEFSYKGMQPRASSEVGGGGGGGDERKCANSRRLGGGGGVWAHDAPEYL